MSSGVLTSARSGISFASDAADGLAAGAAQSVLGGAHEGLTQKTDHPLAGGRNVEGIDRVESAFPEGRGEGRSLANHGAGQLHDSAVASEKVLGSWRNVRRGDAAPKPERLFIRFEAGENVAASGDRGFPVGVVALNSELRMRVDEPGSQEEAGAIDGRGAFGAEAPAATDSILPSRKTSVPFSSLSPVPVRMMAPTMATGRSWPSVVEARRRRAVRRRFTITIPLKLFRRRRCTPSLGRRPDVRR